ncbi:unnamed protein product [Bursaphelenchus okinawaensis]|uniref:BTB domain-containing protein n=1 Tax=Bursaphelenchus okinawaensis TaxID=465554 RepID=A0A811LFV0_9BILA|nr:unnamed protein product [Bursaphelenchus okinawaensis]CAG9121669.1 unnamed protein product [Bursaphelenchus okinawaensis]
MAAFEEQDYLLKENSRLIVDRIKELKEIVKTVDCELPTELDQNSNTDFDLVISTCGRKFKVQKSILMSKSPVFKGMFASEMVESKTDELEVTDDAEAFEAMLAFMYSYKRVEDVELAIKVCIVADKYAVDVLLNQCELFLLENLTFKNAFDCLDMALALNLNYLQLNCSKLMFFGIGKSMLNKPKPPSVYIKFEKELPKYSMIDDVYLTNTDSFEFIFETNLYFTAYRFELFSNICEQKSEYHGKLNWVKPIELINDNYANEKRVKTFEIDVPQMFKQIVKNIDDELPTKTGQNSNYDVTIAACNRKFKVQKSVLISKSPVFKSMFSSKMLESKADELEVTDDAEAFEAMLAFMYSHKRVEDVDLAIKVCMVADKYAVDVLLNQCELFLLENLTFKNAFDCLDMALALNLNYLQLNCSKLMFFGIGKSMLNKPKPPSVYIKFEKELPKYSMIDDVYLTNTDSFEFIFETNLYFTAYRFELFSNICEQKSEYHGKLNWVKPIELINDNYANEKRVKTFEIDVPQMFKRKREHGRTEV